MAKKAAGSKPIVTQMDKHRDLNRRGQRSGRR